MRLKENLKKDPEGWVRVADIVRTLPNDVQEGTVRGLETKIGALISRFYGLKPTRKSSAGLQQRGYAGIRLEEQ